MDKTKFLTIVTIGLFISNLLLIGYIFLNKNRELKREGPKRYIAKRLHLDADQISKYEQMIKLHRIDIRQQDSLILVAKTKLYNCINSNNFTLKDSLVNNLGGLQMAIERVHYAHFLDIKKLCRTDQLSDFQGLLAEMPKLFSGRKPPHKH